ncbi:MAG: polyvinylalcohol dehydrogenase, partial [Planctomycetaceae bacterium]|nr:polyvinylalcohol dehydrogenase [Planctomycetaceae bacterium]
SSDFQNHHGGMVRYGDFIYAGNGHKNGFPTCLEWKSGKIVWGGKLRGAGSGSAAVTGLRGHLLFRYEDGVLALIQATPDEYVLAGTLQPAYQKGASWAHPVVVNGRLYLREQDKLMCYDVTL